MSGTATTHAANLPQTGAGPDDVGRWLLGHADSRIFVAITIIAMVGLVLRRRRCKTKATLDDSMKVLIGVLSMWSCFIIGCVFALTNPIDISMIPTDTARFVGLTAVVVSFVFGWRAMVDVFRNPDAEEETDIDDDAPRS